MRSAPDVIFSAASPQRSGFISIAPPEALARAAADLRQALALGLENAPTLGSLGFNLFAEGVQSADLGIINQSLEYTRRAILLDPTEPVYRYNLGVALAALGRFDEARGAYQDAVLATIYVDPGQGVLRDEPFVEESWLAGALTDLEIVRRYQSELERVTGRSGFEDQLRGLKEQIVGRVASETPNAPADSPAVFANIELQVFPGRAAVAGQRPELRRHARHDLRAVVPQRHRAERLGGDPRGVSHVRSVDRYGRAALPAVPLHGRRAAGRLPARGQLSGRAVRQRPPCGRGLNDDRFRRSRRLHGARPDHGVLPSTRIGCGARIGCPV